MIRLITIDDIQKVISIAVKSGLFPVDESQFLGKMLSDYFERNNDEGHSCVIAEEAGESLGVAYFEPARATDRTWYLTMLAVVRNRQGQGIGSALIANVEHALQKDGQRLLLVETSGLSEFAQTRAFYLKCGYTEEARVSDYYAAGEDMVLFRKNLSRV